MARILAVDDSDQNLVLIELYLKGPEFEVVTARTGKEALEACAHADFDLILLDLVMPDVDGLDVCRRLKADDRTASIPVVFLTSRRDEPALQRGYELGAVDYVTKPVERQELLARLRVMLRLRSSVQRLELESARLAELLRRAMRIASEHRRDLEDFRILRELDDRGGRQRVLLLDADLSVLAANDALAEWLGATPRGRRVDSHRDDGEPAPDWTRELAARMETGEQDFELVVSGGGGERRLAVRVHRLHDDGVLVVTLSESTESRQVAQRLADRAQVELPWFEAAHDEYRIHGLIGLSPALDTLIAMVDQLRQSRSTVLIHGETGVGKELIARALHFDGPHAARPFIPLHCGAISKELIESELFGYEKGAFTGAQNSKQGLFAAADGGTIFLDEIAETSMDLQVKLLRVLQQGEIRPVGATRPQYVDVRIIAATNKDLRALVREGTFREDLYFRLEVVTLEVPALRAHIEDVPLLVEHFLRTFNESHGRQDRRVTGVSQAALRALQTYSWPGNVRELENMIDRAFALGCGDVIQLEDLPERVSNLPALVPLAPRAAVWVNGGGISLKTARMQSERSVILQALEKHHGDKRAAARDLVMSRSTFYRRLKELGIGAEAGD